MPNVADTVSNSATANGIGMADVGVAAAISVNAIASTADASIAANRNVTSTAQLVSVRGNVAADVGAEADATAVLSATAVGAAIAVNAPNVDNLATIGAGLGQVAFKLWQAKKRRGIATQLGAFLSEGNDLLKEISKRPRDDPPSRECEEWIDRVAAYLDDQIGPGYRVRFNDFSGMTFFSGGDGKAKYRDAIDGRMRRLHGFIAEITNQ